MVGRSLSQFMMVAITIERFMVITYPQRANLWFIDIRITILCIAVFVITFTLALPRATNGIVIQNAHKGIPNLAELTIL